MTKHFKEMNYCQFIKRVINFSSTSLFDFIPQIVGIIFLNIADQEKQIAYFGFMISTFFFIFCFSFNFSEPINIKTGIYFSKGNDKQFRSNLYKLCLINIFLLIISFILCLSLKPILNLVSIDGKFIDEVIPLIRALSFTYGPFIMISNWFRGKKV